MKKSINVGDVFTNSRGNQAEVIEYINSRKVRIRFLGDNPHISVTLASQLRDGQFKNPYDPIVRGVGFFGVGEFRANVGGKTTPEYYKWSGIFSRCYCPKYQEGTPAYKGCTVHPDWHNFQVFAAWFTKQKGYGRRGWEIDKDLLFPGNKVYGPDTCVVIPGEINRQQIFYKSQRGLPVGVVFNKKMQRYVVKCRVKDEHVHLGSFKCPKEAFEVYKKHREESIRYVANKWKDEIDERIYEMLMNYEVIDQDI